MVSVGERFGLTPKPDFIVDEVPEGLRITRTSNFTRKRNQMTLPITLDQFGLWREGGGLIQNIMPDLSNDQREFLMSGCTPEEWAKVFPPEEDDGA